MADRNNLFKQIRNFLGDNFLRTKFDKYEDEQINQSFQVLYDAEKSLLTVDKKKKYKESLNIWPNNIDSKIELINLLANSYEKIKGYENLLEEYENEDNLAKEELEINEKQILRARISLALEYDDNKLYGKAKSIFEELYKDDSLKDKIKYNLFASYIKSFDYEAANKFIEDNTDAKRDVRILFQYLVLNILLDKENEAREVLLKVETLNSHLNQAFKDDDWDYDLVNKALNNNDIKDGSMDELGISISYVFPLVFNNSYIYNWIKDALNNEVIEDNDEKNPLNNIVGQAVTALEENGYTSYESFLEISEKELLEIKYIGQKTVEQLKNNGVNFKE